MQKLDKLIKENQGKNILFLGKVLHFTQEELHKFAIKLGVNAVFKYKNENQDIAFTILSTLLTPLEEQISFELYEKGIPEIKLEEFENYYVQSLKPNTLLMSLKLSNNQERLKRLLKVKAFDDTTFLKLFTLYNWGDEGIFDNDNNRDVTLSFIKRFYPHFTNFNHHDIVHSPATILDIALTSESAEVLKALSKMPNYRINARKQEEWKPRELREFIAVNPNIPSDLIDNYLNCNAPRLDTLLAQNSALNQEQQERIFRRATKSSLLMLCKNPNLDNSLFTTLLKENNEVVQALLENQTITKERLNTILKTNSDSLLFLAKNREITDIKEQLLFQNRALDFALAANPALESSDLESLYTKYGSEIAEELCKNPNLSSTLIEKFYKDANNTTKEAIAANPNTPQNILEELFNLDNFEINRHLALNPSLKDEYLDYFKLDNELLRIMSNNPKFLQKVSKKEYI